MHHSGIVSADNLCLCSN